MILALISHRFGFTSHWSVGPVDKSPFGRRFSIHGFAQILSLQATVLTKLRSNRYFSARELRIDFTEHELHELHEYVALSLKIREIQEIRVQKSTLNIIFLVAHGSHGSHGFFSLQATIRISPRLRLYYIPSSYTYQFFEKSYFCIVLQKISCTRQFESQLSLRSLASLFPIKEGIFLPLRLSCKESSTS